MDHALYLRTVFGFDRQTVAAVSHSDQVVLQFGTDILGRNHRSQLRVNPFVGQLNLAANGFQCRTGIISHSFFIDDASTDFMVQIRQWFNLFKKAIQ